jgi:hypothetical protein
VFTIGQDERWETAGMDQFSLFFAFYSLILGLAIAEVLGGFGRYVRSHSTHKVGAQTALLAMLTFFSITATWIDAFTTLKFVDLDVESLWAPILTSTLYYLAATVVFPSSSTDLNHLDEYFFERKRFVIGMLFCCELLASYMHLPVIVQGFHLHPESSWLFYLPFNVALKGSYVALLLCRSRTSNIIWMTIAIFLLVFFYWDNGMIAQAIDQAYGRT